MVTPEEEALLARGDLLMKYGRHGGAKRRFVNCSKVVVAAALVVGLLTAQCAEYAPGLSGQTVLG